MNIKKAIEHFRWKLDPENNQWNATKKDLEAYNCLVRNYKKQQEETLNNNTLFAKLYVIYYGELLKYFESTAMDNIAQKELHKELDKPWTQIVEDFIYKHQTIEMSLQVPKEYRGLHPRETKFKKFVEDTGFKFTDIEKIDFEETENNLQHLINLALNEYQ